jgi:hypothetical protein
MPRLTCMLRELKLMTCRFNLDKTHGLKCKLRGLILSLIKTQGLWCKSAYSRSWY